MLFPRFDNLTLGLALDQEGQDILDSELDNLHDNLSECIMEIEELKNEIIRLKTACTILDKDDLINKIKKTYKNRYFIISHK